MNTPYYSKIIAIQIYEVNILSIGNIIHMEIYFFNSRIKFIQGIMLFSCVCNYKFVLDITSVYE